MDASESGGIEMASFNGYSILKNDRAENRELNSIGRHRSQIHASAIVAFLLHRPIQYKLPATAFSRHPAVKQMSAGKAPLKHNLYRKMLTAITK